LEEAPQRTHHKVNAAIVRVRTSRLIENKLFLFYPI